MNEDNYADNFPTDKQEMDWAIHNDHAEGNEPDGGDYEYDHHDDEPEVDEITGTMFDDGDIANMPLGGWDE